MHLKIIFYLLTAVCALQDDDPDSTDDLENIWFEQYLNHFEPRDNRSFFMRYFEIDRFYKPGGPLLLEIAGELTIESPSIQYSPNYGLAKILHGQIVLLEHRYYGQSSPLDNNSTVEDYQYLTVEQALEDVAYFIETYKTLKPEMNNSKVAVFGCSYAGMLATWMRYKFPHIVDAAWASSPPIRITLDFYQYYEVAGELYSNISSECVAIVRQGYRELKTLLSTTEGIEKVRETFDGWNCDNVTEMSTAEILVTIRLILSNQYNKPNYGNESCQFLQSKNATTTCFEQLAAWAITTADDVCYEDDVNNEMAWLYQTCTQLGYSFTLHSYYQPFKDTESIIDLDLKYCAESFGDEFNLEQLQRSIDRMNRVYGSTHLKVTKVVTIQGTQDPWNKLGLQHNANPEAPVFIIPGASHCSDMSKQEYEPVLRPLIEAKRKAYNLMIKWLQ